MHIKNYSSERIQMLQARCFEPIKNTKWYFIKKAILEALTIFLIPKAIYTIHSLKHNLKIFEEQSSDYLGKGRTVTFDGSPGSGKTFVGSNVAYKTALNRWEALKFEYSTQKAMLETFVRQNDTDKIIAFNALEASYLFFKEREKEFIPCLISTIPIVEYGTNRKSYILTPELFAQIERCPEYSVLFNDESGLDFGSDTSKDAAKPVKEVWRFIRHYFDGMAINTEQDGGNNGIYIRRSTDYITHLYGQEWILPPKRLLKRLERKKQKYYSLIEKNKESENFGIYLYFLNLYTKSIGFRKVIYKTVSREGLPLSDVNYYIIPSIGGVHYDDRAYRLNYQAKDVDITLLGFDKELVEGRN